ncbi:hypothetical protein ACQPT4_00115, partial [Erwinia amylovora]
GILRGTAIPKRPRISSKEKPTRTVNGEYNDLSTATFTDCASTRTDAVCTGCHLTTVISFVNRPDKQWRRTEYNMDGKKC